MACRFTLPMLLVFTVLNVLVLERGLVGDYRLSFSSCRRLMTAVDFIKIPMPRLKCALGPFNPKWCRLDLSWKVFPFPNIVMEGLIADQSVVWGIDSAGNVCECWPLKIKNDPESSYSVQCAQRAFGSKEFTWCLLHVSLRSAFWIAFVDNRVHLLEYG